MTAEYKKEITEAILSCMDDIECINLCVEIAERYAQSKLSEANKEIESLRAHLLGTENALASSENKHLEREKEIERLKDVIRFISKVNNEKTSHSDLQYQEIERLKEVERQWKELWSPVINYFQDHGEKHGIKPGDSISHFILKYFKR